MPMGALLVAVLCAISIVTGSAHAAFPERPIRLIVSFPPGGASDGVARILAEGLSSRLGVPVVVENQGGAAGTIAGAMVARAAPDGYTMLVSATAVFAMVPNLRKLDFDPLHDSASGRAYRRIAARARRLPQTAGEDAGRVHRLRQAEPRQAQLWILGPGIDRSHPDRIVSPRRRHRDRAIFPIAAPGPHLADCSRATSRS